MKPADGSDQQRTSRTAYVAELQCFLCGTAAGLFQSDRKPLSPYGIWRPADGSAPRRVSDWRQLHCGRCGGALYAESIDAIAQPDDDELRREVPRRGRPPKWLVEQRRRDRDSAESRS